MGVIFGAVCTVGRIIPFLRSVTETSKGRRKIVIFKNLLCKRKAKHGGDVCCGACESPMCLFKLSVAQDQGYPGHEAFFA
jgi:hypothetical protein